jgi:hypothetical protein
VILCNCNGYCACCNGFTVLAEDLDVYIKRALLLVLFVGGEYVRIDVRGLNPECVCRITQRFLWPRKELHCPKAFVAAGCCGPRLVR